MSITLDAMRDRLLPLDDVATLLAETEPLTTQHITSDSKISFLMTDGWNVDIEDLPGTAEVDVLMRINGTEQRMTKDAALLAAANVGLPGAYVRKTPGHLIQDHLNHWYGAGMNDTEYNVLSVNDNIAAFVRPKLASLSNINLLESTVAGIRSTYGNDVEILADYKIQNTLLQTDLRLIIPEQQRTIAGSGLADVPAGEADLWSAGIHLSNSVIGKTQTAVEAYLFRWWCTNGATTRLGELGTWQRRGNGEQDAYVWAEEAVNDVLGGMEAKFAEVQALTSLNIAGNTGDILGDIYRQYEIPVSQREAITNLILESESLTMYTIMNALTQVANTPNLPAARADKLMRIGGSIPTSSFDSVKAKVWAEGHTADPTQTNPYEITVG